MKIFRLKMLKYLSFILLFYTVSIQATELKIMTTFLPVYSWAANVAGDKAQVECLLDGKSEPHEFQLTPSDIRKLNKADVVFGIGLELESWLEAIEENGVLRKEVKVINLGELLDKKYLIKMVHDDDVEEHESEEDHPHEHSHHHHGVYDPHIWLDPVLAKECLSIIADQLSQLDTENAKIYKSNAEKYGVILEKLDKDLSSSLEKVQLKPFYVQHDAFAYFNRRYHLNCAGVLQDVPDADISPRHLMKLMKKIREDKVVAIMVPSKAENRLVQRVAKDGNLKIGHLETLEVQDETGLDKNVYERMIRSNLKELINSLK